MSDEQHFDSPANEEKTKRKNEMSRRQFLTYTLGGTGGFMAALPIIPMLRFSVDPLLQEKGEVEYVRAIEADKVTKEPTSVSFKIDQVDGWYESTPTLKAWISRDDNDNIFALSPICKHLGCTVNWNTKPDTNPNEYICPCHDAHYTKDGKHLTVANAPLDEYDVRVENGIVYLGPVLKNRRV